METPKQTLASMAVDWSHLPSELVQLISQKLDTELCLLHFRSVCSTWRSSSIPNHKHKNPLPLKLPQFPQSNSYVNILNSKYFTSFLIKPPQHQPSLKPWLIRIGPDLYGKPQLWHPFSDLYGECELLLVDSYEHGCRNVLWIDVFKLDEKEKKWVKLTDLGDRVLFLGNGCSFSASASELGFANGNCVIFSTSYSFHRLNIRKCKMSVFHLDQGRVSPLSDYPEYFKLFWPPPEWVTELHM